MSLALSHLHGVFLTLLLSMVPVIELRGGLPFGVAMGLSYREAIAAAVIGNMLPAPLVILFARRFFDWLRPRSSYARRFTEWLECRAAEKGELVQRFSYIGLILLVAVPLPGTGVWTGSLIAALLDIRMRRAIPCLFAGACIAAVLVGVLTWGAAAVL